MRSTLKALGLVVVGFLLSIFFQNTVNAKYAHVHQVSGTDSADQRIIELSLQPFHQSPVIDLFGVGK